MATDLPPVPPAVVKYVEEKTTWKKIVPAGTWHQYKVYYMDPQLPDDGKIYVIGLPVYLLYDGKTIRFATEEEGCAITDYTISQMSEEEKKKDIEKLKKKYNLK